MIVFNILFASFCCRQCETWRTIYFLLPSFLALCQCHGLPVSLTREATAITVAGVLLDLKECRECLVSTETEGRMEPWDSKERRETRVYEGNRVWLFSDVAFWRIEFSWVTIVVSSSLACQFLLVAQFTQMWPSTTRWVVMCQAYFCSSKEFAAGVWKCRFWDFGCNCLGNRLSLVCTWK